MPTALMVVSTTLSPRSLARISRAWRWVIGGDMACTSFRNEQSSRRSLPLAFAIRRRDLRRRAVRLQQRVWHVPGAQDRLGVNRAGVDALAFFVGEPAADADDEEERDFQIVDDVAER